MNHLDQSHAPVMQAVALLTSLQVNLWSSDEQHYERLSSDCYWKQVPKKKKGKEDWVVMELMYWMNWRMESEHSHHHKDCLLCSSGFLAWYL